MPRIGISCISQVQLPWGRLPGYGQVLPEIMVSSTNLSVVSRYVDRFGTLKPRNLVTPQPWINIFQNLGNHCNLWNFATFRISLRMTEWCCPAQPRNFRNLATLLKKYFSEFTKIIVTFVTLQLLGFLRKLLNGALRNLVTSITLQP